jgi:hypothetical protein
LVNPQLSSNLLLGLAPRFSNPITGLALIVEKAIPRISSAFEGKSGGFQCRIQAGFFHSKGQPTSQMKEEVDGEQIFMFS